MKASSKGTLSGDPLPKDILLTERNRDKWVEAIKINSFALAVIIALSEGAHVHHDAKTKTAVIKSPNGQTDLASY